MAESLIKTIKAELGSSFLSYPLANRQLFEYIDGFYNTRRLHSALDYRAPAEVERLAACEAPGLRLDLTLARAVPQAATAATATAAPTH